MHYARVHCDKTTEATTESSLCMESLDGQFDKEIPIDPLSGKVNV